MAALATLDKPAGLPDCLKKRRLLNDKGLGKETCQAQGERFLAQGWREDALEFFLLGDCREGLEKLRALALEEGDAHLLGRLRLKDPEVWRRLAERAYELGKYQFARRAFTEAGDQDRAQEIAAEMT